jgi:hypothetical protein
MKPPLRGSNNNLVDEYAREQDDVLVSPEE